ncbi:MULTISPECIES: hypothetical protein [Bacillaceae]|uniref:Phage shock protein B n=1 Tax=Evansella alkalicola TaxID=745819 RepID=A0ABS6JV26_9BACI|nr:MULTISPECIES: hypothetical protein [Bacillaceae]MBU9722417.1 hypothetical protein [Bacillus alkalicola]
MEILTALLPLIFPLGIIIFIIVFVIRTIRKIERRAEERLKLEREKSAILHQQMNEINNRMTNIEKMLKEVD